MAGRLGLIGMCGLIGLSGTINLLAASGVQAQAQTQTQTQPEAPRGRVLLTVSGAVSRPNVAEGPRRHQFDAEMIDALPVQTVRTRTPWHQGVMVFTGPLLADVLRQAGATGPIAQMTALNDYQVRMPLDEVLPHRPILARRANGEILAVRDKGPLFLIFPYDDLADVRNDLFHSRSIWQLKEIEIR